MLLSFLAERKNGFSQAPSVLQWCKWIRDQTGRLRHSLSELCQHLMVLLSWHTGFCKESLYLRAPSELNWQEGPRWRGLGLYLHVSFVSMSKGSQHLNYSLGYALVRKNCFWCHRISWIGRDHKIHFLGEWPMQGLNLHNLGVISIMLSPAEPISQYSVV